MKTIVFSRKFLRVNPWNLARLYCGTQGMVPTTFLFQIIKLSKSLLFMCKYRMHPLPKVKGCSSSSYSQPKPHFVSPILARNFAHVFHGSLRNCNFPLLGSIEFVLFEILRGPVVSFIFINIKSISRTNEKLTGPKHVAKWNVAYMCAKLQSQTRKKTRKVSMLTD